MISTTDDSRDTWVIVAPDKLVYVGLHYIELSIEEESDATAGY